MFVGMIAKKPTGPFAAIGDILTHLGAGLIYSCEQGMEGGVDTKKFTIGVQRMAIHMDVILHKRSGELFTWDGTWGSKRVGHGTITCRIIDPVSFLHEEMRTPTW